MSRHTTLISLCTVDGDEVAHIESSAVPRAGDDITIQDARWDDSKARGFALPDRAASPQQSTSEWTVLGVKWQLTIDRVDSSKCQWWAVVHVTKVGE